ncbi:hypothetical protein ACJJTC_014538 [Scirpophaga incertulas]
MTGRGERASAAGGPECRLCLARVWHALPAVPATLLTGKHLTAYFRFQNKQYAKKQEVFQLRPACAPGAALGGYRAATSRAAPHFTQFRELALPRAPNAPSTA